MRRTQSAAAAERAAEARKEMLDELHVKLADGVTELRSSDRWRDFLTFASGFSRYSFNNMVLLWKQNPEASMVASFNAWKDRGHSVKKGETALRVLAPMTYKMAVEDKDSKPVLDEHGKPTSRMVIRGFKPVPVFDASQVEPAVDRPDLPTLLPGEAPPGMWDALATFVAENGYTLERGECAAGVNGYTDYANRTIRVRDDVDDAQAVKTLAHETGHMLMHAPDAGEVRPECRGTIEVEAESVAFMVAAAHGLDASDYTFAYVSGWAERAARDQGVELHAVIQATGQRVMACADKILTATQPATLVAETTALEKTLDKVEAEIATAKLNSPAASIAMHPLAHLTAPATAPAAAPPDLDGISA